MEHAMTIALAIVIIAISTVLQGITGFGFGLLAAPLLLLFVTKTTSVATLITTGTGLNAYLLWRLRDEAKIDHQLFIWLLASTLIGLPVGVYVLKVVDTHTLRIVAGAFVVLFAALFYWNKVTVPRTNLATVVAGIPAGVLQASIGLLGPLVALLLSGQKRPKNEVRKTLAAFFLAGNIITLTLFHFAGTLSTKGLVLGALCIPGAFLGGHIGNAIARRVSQVQFMRLTFALVFVAGAVAVYTGLTE